jgi:signal peptidase I
MIGRRRRGSEPGKKRSKSTTSSIVELAVIILVALGLALAIQAFVVKPYRIPSGSMEPTLSVGQRVLVNRLELDFGKPHVGEIAVFHPPVGAQETSGEPKCGPTPHVVVDGTAACPQPIPVKSGVNFIKRIVAGPGDTIAIVEGHVIRNGVREKDSYIRPCTEREAKCNFPTAIRVPAGHWFMMGDNRGDSDDSRFWGPVPTSWIIGGAFATYWPPDKIGLL